MFANGGVYIQTCHQRRAHEVVQFNCRLQNGSYDVGLCLTGGCVTRIFGSFVLYQYLKSLGSYSLLFTEHLQQ